MDTKLIRIMDEDYNILYLFHVPRGMGFKKVLAFCDNILDSRIWSIEEILEWTPEELEEWKALVGA
jgi:hypothetical protein